MNRIKSIGTVVVLLVSVVACDAFRDPSPESISVRITGADGTQVLAIYSQVFSVAINEIGEQEVRVFEADSLLQVLPIDTIVNIAESRQFFIQVETTTTDPVEVDVLVDIDGRNVLSRHGGIFPLIPFRYIFLFNRPILINVNVII